MGDHHHPMHKRLLVTHIFSTGQMWCDGDDHISHFSLSCSLRILSTITRIGHSIHMESRTRERKERRKRKTSHGMPQHEQRWSSNANISTFSQRREHEGRLTWRSGEFRNTGLDEENTKIQSAKQAEQENIEKEFEEVGGVRRKWWWWWASLEALLEKRVI